VSNNAQAYATSPAIEISQPLGTFYVTKLKARTLLEITFADQLRVTEDSTDADPYGLTGAQRGEDPKRLKEIAAYIKTAEAAFPNSIILGANYTEQGKLLDQDDKTRWHVKPEKNGECLRLVIPTADKLASIIDGQHRLKGFIETDDDRRDIELLCAVYLDLPLAYQAYIFATINFNQKKVDKSQAYELMGFGIDEEPAIAWSPEKAAVFLSRKLNTDSSSPLYSRIIVAAQNDDILFEKKPAKIDWAISTATIVDGTLRLFSSNPKRDRDEMYKKKVEDGRSRLMLQEFNDRSPLRGLFLKTNDLAIYTIIKNFFSAADSVLWKNASPNSYIIKTVGVQALFDILYELMKEFRSKHVGALDIEKDLSPSYFTKRLSHAASENWSNNFYQASGLGRLRIKNVLAVKLGLRDVNKVSDEVREYLRSS
jgi:DNA phosphorothioation-associated DGQHR protein 1